MGASESFATKPMFNHHGAAPLTGVTVSRVWVRHRMGQKKCRPDAVLKKKGGSASVP